MIDLEGGLRLKLSIKVTNNNDRWKENKGKVTGTTQ